LSVRIGLTLLLVVTVGFVICGQQPRITANREITFSEHLISKDFTYSYGICPADIDGDGDIDLVSADAREHAALYWFENDGKGNFKRHTILAAPQDRTQELVRMERHVVADMNHDGHLDVVIVDNKAGDLRWFENDGTPRDDKPWRLHVIARGTLPGAYDVAVADLDKDGNPDVAATSWRLGNQFAWFRNPGTIDPKNETYWDKHLIDGDLAETRTVSLGDINHDGRIDMLGTATKAGLVAWYENPEQPATQPWKRHLIDKTGRPAHGHLVDMDGDGDLDVVMATGMASHLAGSEVQPVVHQVVWYENVGSPGDGSTWLKHIIAEHFEQGFEAVAADLNADGKLEVVATSWAMPGKVAWFENSGDPRGPWTMHVIKDNWRSANQVVVADFDGDGRPDLAASADDKTNELIWWRNEGPKNH
jgi:FG-GAP-like repeat